MELTHEQLTYSTLEDSALYSRAIYGLPTRKGKDDDGLDKDRKAIPYGSESHIVKHFRETAFAVKPKSILEIGLNLGWSSALWLEITPAKVFSIDISDRDETIEAGSELCLRYPDRFNYLIWDSGQAHRFLKKMFFDLAFVDGGHDEETVTKDIELILKLEIEYILFDDYYERYGPGVKRAIEKFSSLKLVKDMDNLRLYKNDIWE